MTEDRDADVPPAVRALAAEDTIDPVAAVSQELQRKSPRRRIIESALSLGVTVVMCAGAALVSINKVTRLDPAMVFKG